MNTRQTLRTRLNAFTLASTTSRVAGLLATLTLVAAGAAYAHPADSSGTGPAKGQGMGMHHGHGRGEPMNEAEHAARAAQHLAALKTELKITPAQEKAWARFETQMKQQQDAMQAQRKQMRQQMQAQMQAQVQAQGAASAPGARPDHSAQREAMMKLREAHQASRDAAFKELYAVLSPEQKTLADQHRQRVAQGHGHHGHHGHAKGHGPIGS